jgi:hypothetical protein
MHVQIVHGQKYDGDDDRSRQRFVKQGGHCSFVQYIMMIFNISFIYHHDIF